MPIEYVRVVAFCVYLGAWLVLAVSAVMGAIPARRKRADAGTGTSTPEMIGMLMQGTAALPVTLSLGDGPLQPGMVEAVCATVLSPLGAALFWWAQRSAPKYAKGLVTTGAFAMVRHPMYLAFLAMLLATGLLASAGLRLAAGVFLYLAGTELRVASEEGALDERFASEYARYREKTPWRYLPGLR